MTGGQDEGPAPEFSRPVALDTVSEEGLAVGWEAEPSERAAVARRLGLQAVSQLRLKGVLRRQGLSDLFCLTGTVAAEVVQTCVVSLEPLEARVKAGLRREFLIVEAAEAPFDEGEIDIEAEDPPDPVPGGTADLGEVAVEELALALDPYPRKPGAGLPGDGREPGAAMDEGPFSVLRRLKH